MTGVSGGMGSGFGQIPEDPPMWPETPPSPLVRGGNWLDKLSSQRNGSPSPGPRPRLCRVFPAELPADSRAQGTRRIAPAGQPGENQWIPTMGERPRAAKAA